MARGKTVNTQMGSKPLSTSGGACAGTSYPGLSAPAVAGIVPLKIMDETLKPKSARPTPTQTAGMDSRAPRPGTMQRGFGKSNT